MCRGGLGGGSGGGEVRSGVWEGGGGGCEGGGGGGDGWVVGGADITPRSWLRLAVLERRLRLLAMMGGGDVEAVGLGEEDGWWWGGG